MTPAKPRLSAIWLWIFFGLSRIAIFLIFAGKGTDLPLYVMYAHKVHGGQVPFQDFFPEYPPLAIWFIALPGIFGAASYELVFRAICFGIDCGIWLLLLRHASDRPAQGLLYVVCTLALGPVIYDRLDIVLAALLVLALVFLFRRRDGLFWLALGVAIAFKLIPIVLAPVVIAFTWRRGIREIGRCVLLLGLPALLSFGACAALGGYHFDKLLTYHTQRGIQLESLGATVELVLMWFGVPGWLRNDYNSFDLHTAYEGILIRAGNVFLALMVLLSTAMAAKRRMVPESLALLLGAVLCASLALSKVLSTQYFVFLVPFLAFLPIPRAQMEIAMRWYVLLVAALLTGILFPWGYQSLMAFHPTAIVVLMLRNACLIALSVLLFMRAWKDSSVVHAGLDCKTPDTFSSSLRPFQN